MRTSLLLAILSTFCVLSVYTQTITTTDDVGETVVEVITVDPVLGLPTTEILQTLTSTTSTTTTTPDVQGGPVGQPAVTSAGPTVYVYTTTDAVGDTIDVTATFTATFQTSVFTPQSTGTILQYSQWLSMVGSNTVAPSQNAALAPWNVDRTWIVIAVGTLTGVLGGAGLVFA
ncbi:hypothetical protein A0H81_07446 [Grifola frondosa]|uniref:Uncharacterized protein n=1 Tax=Grifola frondosa TaxID=5627 RepID=A0A1C7MB90_GRIFR|nr:hypothetical protein A0H81_07446 [Grifola frondosa]